MADFQLDIMVRRGPTARMVRVDLPSSPSWVRPARHRARLPPTLESRRPRTHQRRNSLLSYTGFSVSVVRDLDSAVTSAIQPTGPDRVGAARANYRSETLEPRPTASVLCHLLQSDHRWVTYSPIGTIIDNRWKDHVSNTGREQGPPGCCHAPVRRLRWLS
jgi:hypothetical protein